MNIHTITVAQVIKMKSRLKGSGLLNKKDADVIGVFIAATEENNPSAITKDMLIDIWHLVQFTNLLNNESTTFKYKNNKRISLD